MNGKTSPQTARLAAVGSSALLGSIGMNILTRPSWTHPAMKTQAERDECSALMAARHHLPTTLPHQKSPRRNASHQEGPTQQALATSSSSAYSETIPSAEHTGGCLSREQSSIQASTEAPGALSVALSVLVVEARQRTLWLLHLWQRGRLRIAQILHSTTTSTSPARATSHCTHQPQKGQLPPESNSTPHKAASEGRCSLEPSLMPNNDSATSGRIS